MQFITPLKLNCLQLKAYLYITPPLGTELSLLHYLPPPHHDWMGLPPPLTTSIVSTCNAAGGMPLAFT